MISLKRVARLLLLVSWLAISGWYNSPRSCMAAASTSDEDAGVASSEEDRIDIVFLGGHHPVFVRFHVTIDGREFRSVWRSTFDKLHDYLDLNLDGNLTVAEAERPGWPTIFINPFNTNPTLKVASKPALSGNGPGNRQVSSKELAEYIASTLSVDSLLCLVGPSPDAGMQMAFDLIDIDRNGELDRQELSSTAVRLAKFDADEDEMIAPSELIPGRSPYALIEETVRPIERTSDERCSAIVLNSPEARKRAARLILELKDSTSSAAASERMTINRLGGKAEAFGTADADDDGLLDHAELVAYLESPPCDWEVMIALGERNSQVANLSIDAQSSEGHKNSIRRQADRELAITTNERLVVDVRSADVSRGKLKSVVRAFERADLDKNDMLTRQEVRGDDLLKHLLENADQNSDGELKRKELENYIEQARDVTSSRTQMMVYDRGELVFNSLDANADGRLSPREMKNAPSIVGQFDLDGDGKVARREVPHGCEVVIGRGFGMIHGLLLAPPSCESRKLDSALSHLPLWFESMDRNLDHDVSSREFLGPVKIFRQLDLDSDGLIDASEAHKFVEGT